MWQIHQLEKLHKIDRELVNKAFSHLMAQDPELREKLVIGAYLENEINLGKAAEFLNFHPMELRQKFLEQGIPVKIGVESKEAIIAEKTSAKAMRENANDSN